MSTIYIPDAGDIVWLEFSPQAGHEQSGRRPALVISDFSYNDKSGLMLCCPMTSKIKHYPFEVLISKNPPSTVLADQVKNMDWVARKATYKSKVSQQIVDEVRLKLAALLEV